MTGFERTCYLSIWTSITITVTNEDFIATPRGPTISRSNGCHSETVAGWAYLGPRRVIMKGPTAAAIELWVCKVGYVLQQMQTHCHSLFYCKFCLENGLVSEHRHSSQRSIRRQTSHAGSLVEDVITCLRCRLCSCIIFTVLFVRL